MSCKVELTDNFKKEAKKLIERYSSLPGELAELFSELELNPVLGKHLGNNIYKIRLSIQSKNKGKSGGARIISCIKVIRETVYLLSIYNKGDKNDISAKEIEKILKSEGLL